VPVVRSWDPNDITGPAGVGPQNHIVTTNVMPNTICPRPTLITGDRVDAVASIVFDVNEPILTPAIFHTIDAGAPASSVDDLPPTVDSTSFLVTWAGDDDAGGSGLASYDIYVATDGGPYTLWLDDTTLTTAPYTGATNHTYAFYSVGKDNAGNVEAAPLVPDATITIPRPNVVPTLELGANANLIEGGALARPGAFIDPDLAPDDAWTATVDYGDGDGPQPLALNPDHSFDLAHPYADDGTYTLIVTVTDSAGAIATDTLTVTVAGVAPTATFTVPTAVVAGATAQVSFSNAVDPSPTDTAAGFTYSFDYDNDGTFEVTGATSPLATIPASFFATAGTTLTVLGRITDADGLSTDYTRTLAVRAELTAPRVTGLFVSSTRWSPSFLGYLGSHGFGSASLGYDLATLANDPRPLPWTTLDSISVRFSEDVNVAQADLALAGVATAAYGLTGFSYDAATHVATWRLAAGTFFDTDRLLLALGDVTDLAGNALDGERGLAAAPFPTGDGAEGGDLLFRFDVLPGDASPSAANKVDGFDMLAVRTRQLVRTMDDLYSPYADVTGSGKIDGLDMVAVRMRQLVMLPPGEPAATPEPGLFAPGSPAEGGAATASVPLSAATAALVAPPPMVPNLFGQTSIAGDRESTVLSDVLQ